MDSAKAVNNTTYDLEDAVEWLHDVLGYMTESEQAKVATPKQILAIVALAQKASELLESSE